MTEWTRDDLPSVADLVNASVAAMAIDLGGGADAALDAVVAHLNAHHPKVDGDCSQLEAQEWAEVVRGLRAERDAAVYAYDKADRERDEWKTRAEQAELESGHLRKILKTQMGRVADAEKAAEARTAPAMSRADIEKCVYGSRRAGRECDKQGFVPVHVQEAVGQLCDLFGIEAEQAVDPVEAKARELYEHVYVGRFEDGSSGVQSEYRKLAAYLLGQEAGQ